MGHGSRDPMGESTGKLCLAVLRVCARARIIISISEAQGIFSCLLSLKGFRQYRRPRHGNLILRTAGDNSCHVTSRVVTNKYNKEYRDTDSLKTASHRARHL
ncbi:hypothetical protein L484_003878 [Morus notabilis]|uniref:Uncharacterized protein n=1 Tax=Morus notabilis TaxID=981085 RepID=W9R2Y2_9ROSA|nr:hypothetical protein L484_003878 [Morus notabilis]